MAPGDDRWKELVASGAAGLGLRLDAGHLERFAVHARQLDLWNRKVNLTAVTDPEAVAIRHFVDSCAPALAIPDRASVLDLGSGGGFPGIPLGILRPDLRITLVDGSRKKVNFQRHVLRCIGLTTVCAEHARAEDLWGRMSFDAVVSRAVADLKRIVALSFPLLGPQGCVVAMKGRDPEVGEGVVEMTAQGLGGIRLQARVVPYRLASMDSLRFLVVLRRCRTR